MSNPNKARHWIAVARGTYQTTRVPVHDLAVWLYPTGDGDWFGHVEGELYGTLVHHADPCTLVAHVVRKALPMREAILRRVAHLKERSRVNKESVYKRGRARRGAA